MERIIDAHIHFLHREDEEVNLLRAMDEAGVEKSLVLPLPGLSFMNACTAGNETVYEVHGRHPDRIAFGVFADPRDSGAIDTVRRYVDLGAKVFKLYPTLGFYPDDAVCMPLYEAIAALGIPVLSHTGASDLTYWKGAPRSYLCSHWADPIRFDGLSRKFPEITWILAHMGFPWSVNAWFVACVNRNVMLDIAGGGMWSTSLPFLYDSVGRQIPIDFERVMWGSDNCLPPKDHIPFSQKILRELGCPDEDFPRVFGGNAIRILRL